MSNMQEMLAMGLWRKTEYESRPALSLAAVYDFDPTATAPDSFKLIEIPDSGYYILIVDDRLNAPFELHALGGKLQFGNVDAAKMHAVKVWKGMQEFK